MSEATNEYFMDTHVKSHETILLDNIRKLAEAYTKNTFLERAVLESRKQIDELTQQNAASQTALQQAVTGLQAVTAERDDLKKELDRDRDNFKKEIEQVRKESSEHVQIFLEKNQEVERNYNNLNVLFNELKTKYDDLNSKAEGYVSDNSTLKKNYNRVLEELNNLRLQEPEPEKTTPTTNIVPIGEKKKSKKQESSEWVDGD